MYVAYFDPEKLSDNDSSQIACIRARFSPTNEPGHRDFLGSLMGCGIKRETIGDIFVGKGICDIVVMKDILPYLLSNFESAGRVKLSVSVIPFEDISIPDPEFKIIKDTVASMRLDNIVSSGFSISRDKASSAVKSGIVALQHQVCVKSDKQVEEGDVISVRGLGKIELIQVGNITRKGRTGVVIKRYV
jgi:RNA-binding protein YlmH